MQKRVQEQVQEQVQCAAAHLLLLVLSFCPHRKLLFLLLLLLLFFKLSRRGLKAAASRLPVRDTTRSLCERTRGNG
jgi:hypothetical protein